MGIDLKGICFLASSFQPRASIPASIPINELLFYYGGSAINLTLGQKAARVQLLILDVDGVLTGGEIILGSEGMELKHFHTRDGLGIAMARRAGLRVAIITGRVSQAVVTRAGELGIQDLFQGNTDKMEVYESLLEKHQLTDEQTAFVGDDLLDLPVLKRAGLKIAVANASGELKARADYVTLASGGQGAVREVVDLLLGWREDGKSVPYEGDESKQNQRQH